VDELVPVIFEEFFQDGELLTTSVKAQKNEFANLAHTAFDSSFVACVAVFSQCLRKIKVLYPEENWDHITTPMDEGIRKMTLLSPLGCGGGLRALCYPKAVYRKLEVPAAWLKEKDFLDFRAHLPARFVLDYHERNDQSWQVCSIHACTEQGKDLADFKKILITKGQEP